MMQVPSPVWLVQDMVSDVHYGLNRMEERVKSLDHDRKETPFFFHKCYELFGAKRFVRLETTYPRTSLHEGNARGPGQDV